MPWIASPDDDLLPPSISNTMGIRVADLKHLPEYKNTLETRVHGVNPVEMAEITFRSKPIEKPGMAGPFFTPKSGRLFYIVGIDPDNKFLIYSSVINKETGKISGIAQSSRLDDLVEYKPFRFL